MKTIFALLISFCVLSFPAWIEPAFSAAEAQGAVTTQSYAGKASVVTGPVRYKAGDYRIDYSSKGKGFFVITLRYASGEEDVVVDRVGFGPGSYEFTLRADQDLVFAVKSYGSWTIDVRRKP
jgi:hypothetical protein